MHFHFRNCNNAFKGLVSSIHQDHIPVVCRPSRVGEILKIEEPVTITYTHPRERVLFNQARDCNCFFHLFEALWMLAGRNDVAPLRYYNPRMAEYSDDGETFHGAYGHRWRNYPGDRHRLDQLLTIAANLKADPNCRRQVLQVWDATRDLGNPGRDLPCNTQAYFSVRAEPDGNSTGTGPGSFLDMTVCNRSNDMVWGMLGANVVHWSILQEYLACRIGVGVGHYHQITNNLHVYTERWEPDKWLAEYDGDEPPLFYGNTVWPCAMPLVQDPERFDAEVNRFVDIIDGDYDEPFLQDVAQPMMAAFRRHKQRQYIGDDNAAMNLIERVRASDWRLAGRAWLNKRRENWNAKNREAGVDEA